MNKKGITFIEVLVVVVILGVVLAITFESYFSIVRIQTQQSNIASSNLNTTMSVEMLRRDIEMAGFGLPRKTFGCTEAVSDPTYTPNPDVLNTPDCTSPLPFTFSNNTGPNDSDAIAIRSSIAALNNYTQHWGYVYESYDNYTELGSSGSVSNIYFDIIDPTTMSLVEEPCKLNSCTASIGGRVFLAFGIGGSVVTMPFNRVDYFLYKPSSMPRRCAPGTYELYRATINQSDGKRNIQPIMDCVEDFQVEFGLDTNGDGIIDRWVPSSGYSLPSDLYTLDTELKQVRVFIVYQEGKRDPNFVFSGSLRIGDNYTGTLKEFTPSPAEIHYRWRMIEVVVDPINIRIRERNLK